MKPFKLQKDNSAEKLLFGLGDPLASVAKVSQILLQEFHDLDQLATADPERIASIDSLGMVVAESLKSYFAQEDPSVSCMSWKKLESIWPTLVEKLLPMRPFQGMTVVLTGKLERLTFRSKGQIESLGAKGNWFCFQKQIWS